MNEGTTPAVVPTTEGTAHDMISEPVDHEPQVVAVAASGPPLPPAAALVGPPKENNLPANAKSAPVGVPTKSEFTSKDLQHSSRGRSSPDYLMVEYLRGEVSTSGGTRRKLRANEK